MTQTPWYYVAKNAQRVGPMDASVLIDALRHGQLDLNSMVWQEGMSAWQPLSMQLDAIGVPAALRIQRKEKSSSNSNAAIWVVAIVGGGFALIAVLGILAAIAIPAYQDYTIRAKLSEAMNQAAPVKLWVSEQYQKARECPNNVLPGTQFPTPESYAGRAVSRIEMGAFENGSCAIVVSIPDTLAAEIQGGNVTFELANPSANAQWHCFSDTIKNKYLPANCRQ